MKNLVCVLAVAGILMVAGCCSKAAMKKCQMQDECLKAKVSQLEKALADEKANSQKIKAESDEMQTTAMQSITTMLSKDKAVQDKLQAKINELTTANSKLTGELEAAKAAAATAAPAAQVPADSNAPAQE
ncbi:MAG: hypothetical protein A2Y07_03845 [Planctomycetes bacterium GWF2_50_10]|nr:MAG: hypothetical protein A2Y07_03845 [Planctomycetes bacterium GWF2_50_10]